MGRIMRGAVLAMSLVSLFAVMSSAAGAVTWTNTGQTRFTATSGAGTLSTTGASLVCSGGDGSGTTRTPVAGVGAAIAAGTIIFTDCRMGGAASGVHCAYTLTANSFSGGITSGSADVTCGVFVAGRENCHIEGGVAASYFNGSVGRLWVPASAQLVTTNGSGGGSCALGARDRASLTALFFNTTGGTGPVIATD